MISTPIGISIQSQMPILYPQTEQPKTDSTPEHTTPSSPQHNPDPVSNTILDINLEDNLVSNNLEQSELYAEYMTNPYTEKKDITAKEATLYDPEMLTPNDQTVPERNSLLPALEQKSLSENATPMHKNKAQFGSSDNIKQESSIFNFSSYFGVNEMKGGSEVFDTLMSTQEG